MRAMKLGMVLAVVAAIAGYGTSALADSSASTLPPTWHVHDCGAAPCVWPHAATAFFPYILGMSKADYLASGDPVMCPDATDKALLGGGQPGSATGGLNGSQPLGAGICMTSTSIIHLYRVPLGTAGPDGWSLVPASVPGGLTVVNGVTYVTYFLVTSR